LHRTFTASALGPPERHAARDFRNRKDPICFSPYLYRVRNLIERSSTRSSNVGVSRPDPTNSANYLTFTKLESIGIWLVLMNP